MVVRAPTPGRAGAAAVALALALALAAPAGAASSSTPGAAALAVSAGLTRHDVRVVQRRLADLGYLPGSGVDGLYGEQTRGAVIAFQKWELLPRDGIAGPLTRGVLAKAKRPRPLTKAGGDRVEILLDRQLLLLIRKGRVRRISHVSTGRHGFATPRGSFEVRYKRRRSWSVPYKVWMPWASYFATGVAIHQSRNVPVEPVSHGCVRVSRYEAKWLFRRTPVGTPVRVLART